MAKKKSPENLYTSRLNIKCPEAFMSQLQEISKRKGINASALVRSWVMERIIKEQKKAQEELE